MPDPYREQLRQTLAGAVAALTGNRRLVVVEIAVDRVITCEVRRDEDGTPRGRGWSTAWTDLGMEHGWDETDATKAEQAVLQAAEAHSPSDVILTCSLPDSSRSDQAFEWLRAARPDAPAFRVDVGIARLLEEVISDDPLRQPYDLVVLRADPRTGRLTLGGRQLFPSGARRGDRAEVTVRCAPSDERGTVFAVVTWQGREPQPVSIHAAKIPPGLYTVTALLERPGRVTFTNLGGLVKDPRGWDELVASVPARVAPPARQAHLICAVEICGADAKVDERLSRIRQMITTLSGESTDRLQVSLIAYGAHSFDRKVRDERVELTDWRVSPGRVLDSLRRLEERGAVGQGYPYHPHAAQLEDMLAEVARRLDLGDSGPTSQLTVLLTVGDRAPHPPREHRSGILPCPNRHDWEPVLRRLEQRQGMSFGAICDQPAGRAHAIWRRLGAGASAHLDALDIRGLGADLGLAPPRGTPIPLPLIEEP